MPSSPRLSNADPSYWYGSRSTLLVLCSLIVFSSFVLGFVMISRTGLCSGCNYGKGIMSWNKSSAGGLSKDGGLPGEVQKRPKAKGFVGVQTGFESAGRRRVLRQTWFPSDRQALQRLEESTGLVFRFVIGGTSDRLKMAELQKEISEYDDFLLLDVEERYSNLPYKTLAFFRTAYALYESEFYVKADDDIYLRPDRLSLLLAEEQSHPRLYLGCMKKGSVYTDPTLKWYEPLSHLLGKQYFLHAYGPIYVISADVVAVFVSLRNDSFRMFYNEDVTVGSWMLAMDVEHEHNEELCSKECTDSSIAVWDIPKCGGLCKPEEKMLKLHESHICSKSPTRPIEVEEEEEGGGGEGGNGDAQPSS